MPFVPEVAVWEFTFMCNVDCLHCGSDCTEEYRPDELNTAEALDLVDQLADLGCKSVTLSGGEPFVRKDWAIVANRIKQRGMDLVFVSNGFLIDAKTAHLISRLKPKSIAISLDAGEPELHDYIRGKKGCFAKALNTLDLLLNEGVFTSVITSLQKINVHQLEAIKQIVLLYGVDAWQIQVATPQGRMVMDTAITEAQYYEAAKFIAATNKRYKNTYITGADCFGYYGSLDRALHPWGWAGCYAGMRAIGIESNGNIKGCLSLPGEKFIEGNIREKPLAEIWNKKDAFKFNRQFSHDMLTGYCAECAYNVICRGGCTERSYGFTKEFCENPLCIFKIEQKGFSSKEQSSINPEPEKTDAYYNGIRALPEGFTLKNRAYQPRY